MILTDLHIHDLRNIHSAKLSLHSNYNIFSGPNGSGKTSVLEAVYMLGTGHSFRTREIASLVQQTKPHLTLYAKTGTQDSISIQKALNGPTIVKMNQEACRNSSELARFLPCQVLYQDIFNIMDAGPSVRRHVLDWGLFHVKPSYHQLWQTYRHVLKQRNALLRQKAPRETFRPWDRALVELAYELDAMRAAYFTQWADKFHEVLAQLSDMPCILRYDKGWDRKQAGKGLDEILEAQFQGDVQRQYTQSGAHQADIVFDTQTAIKAKRLYSRGQQKMILTALKFAQSELLERPCLYLMDDVVSELDAMHLEALLYYMTLLKGQFFMTITDQAALARLKVLGACAQFDLKHGQIL